MKIIALLILVFIVQACQMDEIHPQNYYACSTDIIDSSLNHPKNNRLHTLMNSIVRSGAPGIQFSVHDSNGFWNGTSGLADLASNIELTPCNITRVGSTVKTFTAVTILLLQEEGFLKINEPITNYLSANQIKGLKNAKKSTIEQLLKHSSGIYNYIQSAQFQTASLNDLTKVWQPDDLLDYARGQDAYFSPGENVLYSNTNYILLGMIIEKVTGKPFYKAFQEMIFEPLDMEFTQFAAEDPVPDGIVRGYVDFYSNYNLINATNYSGWDYYTADGGLISNAYDLNVFLHALFNGQILTQESLRMMIDWQEPNDQSADGFHTAYGLGIFEIKTEFGPAYLHSGDAIGYFASMVHLPHQNVTLTWTVNANYGKIDQHTQSKETMENIFKIVLE